MGDKKKFDSWQGGNHAEIEVSHSQCYKFSDAEIMERILTENKNNCPAKEVLALSDVKRRLAAQGKQILLINQAPYRDSLTECEQCTHHKGGLPTGEEIQNCRQ